MTKARSQSFFSDGHAKATTTNHLFHNSHLISLLIVNDSDVSRSSQHSSCLIDNFLDQLMAQVAKIFINLISSRVKFRRLIVCVSRAFNFRKHEKRKDARFLNCARKM